MALCLDCSRCGKYTMVDRCCSPPGEVLCFNCIMLDPSLKHNLNCPTGINEENLRRQVVKTTLSSIKEGQEQLKKMGQTIEALEYSLRQIAPCPQCQGQNPNHCKACQGKGYKKFEPEDLQPLPIPRTFA